jgi:tight adherence protein C
MSAAGGLGLAWAGLVLAVAIRLRPPPARLRALVASAAAPADDITSPARVPALGRVGHAAHRLVARRRPPLGPVTARRLGGALVAGALVLPVVPVAAPVAALAAWAVPGVRAAQADRRRLAEIAADLPEVVDLLLLAIGAGLNVPLAIAAVAHRARGPLAAELGMVVDETAVGRRVADALDDLPARAGEATRPLVAALVASERYGAPLAAGLERLADEVRRQRRRRAEEAARRVPVKLLFPLITCTLPAFALLTVAPLVASAARSLRL